MANHSKTNSLDEVSQGQERKNLLIRAIDKAFKNSKKLNDIRGEEKSFDELIKYSEGFGIKNWGVVQRNKELQTQLKNELEERGIRKMSFVDSGDEAAVFLTTQGQILRLSNSSSKEPLAADSAGVVPVLDSFSLKSKDSIFGKQYLHAQITPEVTMAVDKDNLTKKDLSNARKDISRAGYADGIFVSDLQGKKNIGFYDNGSPVNPDLGSAFELKTVGKAAAKIATKILDLQDPENGPTKTNERLENARDEHLRNRGLEIGEVKGTFPKSDMDQLRERMGKNSQETRIMEELIENRGMYKEDMAELLAEAYADKISKSDFKEIIDRKNNERTGDIKTKGKMDHLERYISQDNSPKTR